MEACCHYTTGPFYKILTQIFVFVKTKIFIDIQSIFWYHYTHMKFNHVALIPDGNRRWAKERDRPVFFGHRQGAKQTEEIIKIALELEIPCITFWGCSVNNITKRKKQEIKFLFNIFESHFKKLLKNEDIYKKEVRVRFLGKWEELLPENTKKPMRELLEKTKNHKKYNLTFLMAYNGTDEMVSAIKSIIKNKISPDKIDEKTIKQNLWTKELPPIDLVIRTGGEPHWSVGFMMFDVANAQLYFTETFWPAFGKEEFKKAIGEYMKTERRLGK